MLIQLIINEPKLKCLKVLCIKDQFKTSKTFSKTKKSSSPGISFGGSKLKFIKLSINLIFSPINLPFINPACSLFTSFGITFLFFLRGFAIALVALSQSQFSKVIGCQFLMRSGSASYFGITEFNNSPPLGH